MIYELHQKYINSKLSPDLVEMFADIIESEEVTKKICIYIGKTEENQRTEDTSIKGVTINSIVENVVVDRLVKVGKGRNYNLRPTRTNINRKAAEKHVDKLLDMSLLFYKPVKPYKFLFLTRRGWQVLEEILRRSKL